MGVVGIHVHGLKNLDGKTATKGSNPVRRNSPWQEREKTLDHREVLYPFR